MSSSKSPVVPVPAPAAANDTIARNRILAFAPADAFPPMPAGYKPTDREERRRSLRPVTGSLVAECLRATREIAGKGEALRADLGDFAPDPGPAAPLAARIEALEAAIHHQEMLLACYHELEDIALTDALELLESARDEYEHRVSKVPGLAMRYPMLTAFFQAKSDAISEGRARKNKKPAAELPAPNGDG